MDTAQEAFIVGNVIPRLSEAGKADIHSPLGQFVSLLASVLQRRSTEQMGLSQVKAVVDAWIDIVRKGPDEATCERYSFSGFERLIRNGGNPSAARAISADAVIGIIQGRK